MVHHINQGERLEVIRSFNFERHSRKNGEAGSCVLYHYIEGERPEDVLNAGIGFIPDDSMLTTRKVPFGFTSDWIGVGSFPIKSGTFGSEQMLSFKRVFDVPYIVREIAEVVTLLADIISDNSADLPLAQPSYETVYCIPRIEADAIIRALIAGHSQVQHEGIVFAAFSKIILKKVEQCLRYEEEMQ